MLLGHWYLETVWYCGIIYTILICIPQRMKLILRIKWENTVKLLTQYLTHDRYFNMSVFQHLLNSESVSLLAKKGKGGYLSHRIALKIKRNKTHEKFYHSQMR